MPGKFKKINFKTVSIRIFPRTYAQAVLHNLVIFESQNLPHLMLYSETISARCNHLRITKSCIIELLAEKEFKMSDEIQQWGIVELMGHKVVAGLIQKSEMLGKPMLRVDVPATSTYQAFTQFYGEAAIYCVTFTSEDVAKRTAEEVKVNPVSVYVPDLVTKEKYEELRVRADDLQNQVYRLKRLPQPAEEEAEF